MLIRASYLAITATVLKGTLLASFSLEVGSCSKEPTGTVVPDTSLWQWLFPIQTVPQVAVSINATNPAWKLHFTQPGWLHQKAAALPVFPASSQRPEPEQAEHKPQPSKDLLIHLGH